MLKSCQYVEKIILDRADSSSKLIALEKYYIKKYDALNRDNFLNLTEGGDGGDTFILKSKEEIADIISKRSPESIKRSITGLRKWRENNPEIVRQSVKKMQAKRIITYSKAVLNRTPEKKAYISELCRQRSLSFWNTVTPEQLCSKINRFRETMKNLSPEQKEYNRSRKSVATKRMNDQIRADPERFNEYKLKLGRRIRERKALVTEEEQKISTEKYKFSMYCRSKLYPVRHEVYSMMCCGKSITEIVVFLKTQYNISTSSIPLKMMTTKYKIYENTTKTDTPRCSATT